jgi:GT2 family glycosyltransferase
MLSRRSVYEIVGNYDESLRLAEDVDWFMRARDAGVKITTIGKVVLRYRVHATNTTRQYPARQAAVLRVFRASVERRRERGDG